jgi:mannose-6-phosphate isomerase-like protein (cupin superfamily)
MRNLIIGVALGVAMTLAVTTLKAQGIASSALSYASAADVAAALRQIGQNNGNRPVVQLDPYTVLAEHRIAPQDLARPASIHNGEAELYFVIEGAATLVTGRTPNQESGGIMRRITKGDVLIIPENTPHWFSAVDGSLSYLSMHMPRPLK